MPALAQKDPTAIKVFVEITQYVLAIYFQSELKSDTLKACDTPTNPNKHILVDRQTWSNTKEQL